jgi:hypothetical protein
MATLLEHMAVNPILAVQERLGHASPDRQQLRSSSSVVVPFRCRLAWRSPDTYHAGRSQAGDRRLTSIRPGTTSEAAPQRRCAQGLSQPHKPAARC